MKKHMKAAAFILLVGALFLLSSCHKNEVIDEPGNEVIDGGVTETLSDGNGQPLEGKIQSFSYRRDGDFELVMVVENGKVNVEAYGGNSDERDGTLFKLAYTTVDSELPDKINEVIVTNELYKNNGYSREVAGLPFGIGEYLKVVYDGGKLYQYNNQSRLFSDEVASEFFKLFKQDALLNGYGFDSAGSNLELYDDPTVDFLQGTFIGSHFGKEMIVEFEGNHVKIYYDGQLMDDVDYVIIESSILPDVKREKPIGNRERDVYEYFNSCTSMSKAFGDRLTAHFYINKANSTCDLIKE